MDAEKPAEMMIARGLRATLESPSLITGQKIVAFQIMPGAKPDELRKVGEHYVIPAVESGGFDSITRAASSFSARSTASISTASATAWSIRWPASTTR